MRSLILALALLVAAPAVHAQWCYTPGQQITEAKVKDLSPTWKTTVVGTSADIGRADPIVVVKAPELFQVSRLVVDRKNVMMRALGTYDLNALRGRRIVGFDVRLDVTSFAPAGGARISFSSFGRTGGGEPRRMTTAQLMSGWLDEVPWQSLDITRRGASASDLIDSTALEQINAALPQRYFSVWSRPVFLIDDPASSVLLRSMKLRVYHCPVVAAPRRSTRRNASEFDELDDAPEVGPAQLYRMLTAASPR